MSCCEKTREQYRAGGFQVSKPYHDHGGNGHDGMKEREGQEERKPNNGKEGRAEELLRVQRC